MWILRFVSKLIFALGLAGVVLFPSSTIAQDNDAQFAGFMEVFGTTGFSGNIEWFYANGFGFRLGAAPFSPPDREDANAIYEPPDELYPGVIQFGVAYLLGQKRELEVGASLLSPITGGDPLWAYQLPAAAFHLGLRKLIINKQDEDKFTVFKITAGLVLAEKVYVTPGIALGWGYKARPRSPYEGMPPRH